MNNYLEQFKSWYDSRYLREKLLVILLGWALLYSIFSLLLFRPLESSNTAVLNEIKDLNNQINTWRLQINAIKKIPESPLYKEWLKHRQALQHLQGEYRSITEPTESKQWHNVIKTVLKSQHNITLLQIQNSAESVYNPTHVATDVPTNIYQQTLTVVVSSTYFDTISYLKLLETQLPNIHWYSLNYQVTQYPIAKVQMEFSIIYDKD